MQSFYLLVYGVATLFNLTLLFTSHRYTYILDQRKEYASDHGVLGLLYSLIWNPPRLAVFFAYFRSFYRPCSQDILYLVCCPANLREQVLHELEGKGIIPSEENSAKNMIPGRDKAFVFVSGGISPVNMDGMEDFHLR